MYWPGANHLDRQRSLLPRDYLIAPAGFGQSGQYRVVIPAEGDEPSAVVAHMQHRIVVGWRRHRTCSAAALARKYEFSKQVMSRSLLGDRWAGELVIAVLLADTLAAQQP